jgi:hypothetical protein
MDFQPMNPENPTPAELEFDQRLTRALETASEFRIPAGFAARVASQVPARPPLASTPTHFGDRATLLGVFVTLAALFWLVLRTHPGPAFGYVETFLLAQFIGLTVWLSLRRHNLG